MRTVRKLFFDAGWDFFPLIALKPTFSLNMVDNFGNSYVKLIIL